MRANPELTDDDRKMTMTVAEFRKQQEKAYREGYAEGMEEADDGDSVKDLFNQLFGR